MSQIPKTARCSYKAGEVQHVLLGSGLDLAVSFRNWPGAQRKIVPEPADGPSYGYPRFGVGEGVGRGKPNAS